MHHVTYNAPSLLVDRDNCTVVPYLCKEFIRIGRIAPSTTPYATKTNTRQFLLFCLC